MIKAERLTRRYGDFTAVDEVGFTIESGAIVGLLGHNGAGKTTIMKMLTGYLEPSAGRVVIDDVDMADDPASAQARIGYLPENLPLYPEMTVVDYLDFAAELRGVEPGERPDAIREAVAATELHEKAFDPISTLSRGFRQRVGVAQAILHRPRFLILDEPTNGLDPSQTQHMRALIQRLAQNATVILSTHIMQEVNAICDRVMILRAGRLAVDEPLSALRDSQRLLVVTDAAELRAALAGVAGLGEITLLERGDGWHRFAVDVTTSDSKPPAAAVAKALIGAGHALYSLNPEQRDLETLFAEVNEGVADAA